MSEQQLGVEWFRILIIGNANAGKTTILRKVCHAQGDDEGNEINSALEPSLSRGKHNIEHQFQSHPFIFHDSNGFEAGGDDELKKVKEFIQSRAEEKVFKNQLHVIWYCMTVSNDRPMTEAELSMFESGTGNVPVIVIFTKMDALDEEARNQLVQERTPFKKVKEQVPIRAKTIFEKKYLQRLQEVKHKPRYIVQLRDMNKQGTDCNELVVRTSQLILRNLVESRINGVITSIKAQDGLYLKILNRFLDQDFLKIFLGLLVARRSISGDNLSDDDAMLMNISRAGLREELYQMSPILELEPYIESFLDFLQDPSRSSEYHVSKTVGTRRYLELITKLLTEYATRLADQPDFHGIDHFDPEFGKLINRNPQSIELDIVDWEQILRPLLNVLDSLLLPSNIDSLTDRYCQQCHFFQITYNTLKHLKSLREREDQDVEKYLKSLEKIIRHGGRQSFNMNFGRIIFGSAVIVGTLMAVLAHQHQR